MYVDFITILFQSKVVIKPLFELCGDGDDIKSQYYLFGKQFEYWFYSAWCANQVRLLMLGPEMDLVSEYDIQGGALATPSSPETFHEMMDVAEALQNKDIHEKCFAGSGALVIWTGDLVLGLWTRVCKLLHYSGLNDEQEEGTWVNPYTKEAVDISSLWEPGSPNGEAAENCAKTNLDRKWKDATCAERNCALCHFPGAMNVTLRGLCGSETKIMEGFFDISYFLKGFVNLKPHWRGYGKSHIYYDPKKGVWRLESFYDREKRAEFFANDENPYDYWPTGRSKWRINAGICQLKNKDRKYT